MGEPIALTTVLDKIVFLKQVPMFDQLSLDELGLIAGISGELEVPEEAELIMRGRQHDDMFIIVNGHVELSGVTADGQEGTIGVLGEKEAIGENTVLDQTPSMVTAQVIFSQARLLVIPGGELLRLVRQYPEIGLGMLRASHAKLRRLEALLMKMA